jgi:adenosylhomocysteine nucleosidase
MHTIGIMGAMPEEIEGVLELISERTETRIGGRTYHSGMIHGIRVVVAFSRWGKVAASSTVTTLLHAFKIRGLIFTGVAGAIHPQLKVGDIVIGRTLVQHDMDARPLMPRHEIPLLGKTWFETDAHLSKIASNAIKQVLSNQHLHSLIPESDLLNFHIHSPSLFEGEIASGDQFFSSLAQKRALLDILPQVRCIEMEGAAVAQVCFENELPFTVIRTISDIAGDNSGVDFPLFVSRVASKYSVAILDEMFRHL